MLIGPAPTIDASAPAWACTSPSASSKPTTVGSGSRAKWVKARRCTSPYRSLRLRDRHDWRRRRGGTHFRLHHLAGEYWPEEGADGAMVFFERVINQQRCCVRQDHADADRHRLRQADGVLEDQHEHGVVHQVQAVAVGSEELRDRGG